MNVPLLDEVTQSRARVELATRANQVVQAARWDLAVLGGHLTRLSLGGQVHELPGDHTLSLAESIWPDSMRPVMAVAPTGVGIEERLVSRQQQLRMAVQIYGGTASALESLSEQLNALVRRQDDLLQKVENWELLRLVMLRRQASVQFAVQALPLNPQQIDLSIVTQVLSEHLPVLHAERAHVEDSVDVFVLHSCLSRLLSSIQDQLSDVQLWPSDGTEPPEAPGDLADAVSAVDALFVLCDQLLPRARVRLDEVRAQLGQINAKREEASGWLRETLG
ncbi:MAG: hypothetical protein ACI9MC_000662 [Kiritimatiellia bacterium]|jgi:hypothetical protein